MREPVFNETLQLGIVVRDLEATMRRYVDDYGIGPWEVYEFDAGKAEDFREYGQPVELLLAPGRRHDRPGALSERLSESAYESCATATTKTRAQKSSGQVARRSSSGSSSVRRRGGARSLVRA